MIVRCDQLRAIGILDKKSHCCPDCHGPAGCVGDDLPGGHQYIHCCARIEHLTAEDVALILIKILRWEALMRTPAYVKNLRNFLTTRKERLKNAQGWRQRDLQCTIKRVEQLLTDVGAPLDE